MILAGRLWLITFALIMKNSLLFLGDASLTGSLKKENVSLVTSQTTG
jgi:hypothetical protein